MIHKFNFFILVLLIVLLSLRQQLQASGAVAKDCTFNGKPLYGSVKIVDAFPDFKVQVVDAFADLKVKRVDAFADSCGEWKVVDAFPDFTVKIVDAFPDFKIKYVDAFPGL